MSDDSPTVPIVCPACDTETRVPIETLAETLERHNEQRHDGEEKATVEPAVRERIADLAADDLGLE